MKLYDIFKILSYDKLNKNKLNKDNSNKDKYLQIFKNIDSNLEHIIYDNIIENTFVLVPKFELFDFDINRIIKYFNSGKIISKYIKNNIWNIDISELKNELKLVRYSFKLNHKYKDFNEQIENNKWNWIHEDINIVKLFINYIFGNLNNLNKHDELLLLEKIVGIGNIKQTGKIGELIFEKYLKYKHIDYESQFKIQNFILDFKDLKNEIYYEIKYSIYNMNGTAYEKILNVPHKYRNLKKNKLYVILIGKQEIKNQGVFDNDERNLEYINLFKNHETEFIKFSDLIMKIKNENDDDNENNEKDNDKEDNENNEKDNDKDNDDKYDDETEINENEKEDEINENNKKDNIIYVKPFIKWVGGKSKISNKILNLIYQLKNKQNIYCEPFIGGGSILFELLNNLNIHFDKYIINDINTTLINTYKYIKFNISELINELKELENKNDKNDYLNLRDEYNEINESIHKSALFIYLNKTCFRGIYRVNKNNKFNVPYGNYKTINFDYNNLKNIHKIFNDVNIEFYNLDYIELINNNKNKNKNTVYYLDPPYLETFNDYTFKSFDSNKFYKIINNLNSVIFSNSNEFNEQYDLNNFEIETIELNESINSKNPSNKRYEILCYK